MTVEIRRLRSKPLNERYRDGYNSCRGTRGSPKARGLFGIVGLKSFGRFDHALTKMLVKADIATSVGELEKDR